MCAYAQNYIPFRTSHDSSQNANTTSPSRGTRAGRPHLPHVLSLHASGINASFIQWARNSSIHSFMPRCMH